MKRGVSPRTPVLLMVGCNPSKYTPRNPQRSRATLLRHSNASMLSALSRKLSPRSHMERLDDDELNIRLFDTATDSARVQSSLITLNKKHGDLGMTLGNTADGNGVLVMEAKGLARQHGIIPGDVIYTVNEHEVTIAPGCPPTV